MLLFLAWSHSNVSFLEFIQTWFWAGSNELWSCLVQSPFNPAFAVVLVGPHWAGFGLSLAIAGSSVIQNWSWFNCQLSALVSLWFSPESWGWPDPCWFSLHTALLLLWFWLVLACQVLVLASSVLIQDWSWSDWDSDFVKPLFSPGFHLVLASYSPTWPAVAYNGNSCFPSCLFLMPGFISLWPHLLCSTDTPTTHVPNFFQPCGDPLYSPFCLYSKTKMFTVLIL